MTVTTHDPFSLEVFSTGYYEQRCHWLQNYIKKIVLCIDILKKLICFTNGVSDSDCLFRTLILIFPIINAI